MRENREKLQLSNQDGVHLFVLLFVLVWIWHPDCSSCTMGQPRWFTSSLHQWVIHCHPAPPSHTHTPLFSSHAISTLWSHAPARGCAPGPFSVNTMGWKPAEKPCPLSLCHVNFRRRLKKRASGHALCIHTSHRHTQCYSRNTLHAQNR